MSNCTGIQLDRGTTLNLIRAVLVAALCVMGISRAWAQEGMAGMPGMTGAAVKLDTAKIESLTGLKGTMNEKEGVFKVSYPRNDIQATAAGVKLTPAMGLTCWVSFIATGNQVMCMGDTVLLE